MSEDGMKKIDRLATEIQNDIIKTEPELQRYA
jgi:ribosomal protein S19E (S16A)